MPERVEIKWNDAGIVPVIIQHDESGEVLMLNWMNAEALRLTQETGRTHFWDSAQRSVWQPDGEKVQCSSSRLSGLIVMATRCC